MNGLRAERGQVFVLTALSMTILLGMTALVLDVGDWYRTKRQLQATADAAALAGAQALPNDPAKASSLALDYANGNGGGADPNDISVQATQAAGDTIAVKAKKQEPGFFSRVLGVDSVAIGASAKARVGVPAWARHVAPMVVSEKHPLISGPGCLCLNQETTLNFDPMGAPGAFGMLDLDGQNGTVGTSEEKAWILHGYDKFLPLGDYPSDPGAKFSSQEVQGALDLRIGTVLLFPVFRTLTGQGSNAEYQIIGWIGFHLDSYDVHGNNAVLTGYFTEFIAQGLLAGSGASSPPNFGVKSVRLIG
jgi:hypothetical protein